MRLGRSPREAAVTAAAAFALVLVMAAAAPDAVSRAAGSHTGAAGYADGAPPGFSGGFGEESCHACHFHADPNVEPGRLTLAGVPDVFSPGERYPITVTLTRPGLTIGGFQLTTRFAEGGAQAGSLAAGPGEDPRVAIERQAGVQYANQRTPGTLPVAPDTARWTLTWTAPATPAIVRVHVSANAADQDGSAGGDYVYTADAEARPR